MSSAIPTVALDVSALGDAAAIQARAFFDDPLFEYVFPDATTRAHQLAWLVRAGIGVGLHLGHVHTTPGSMLGHAVWLPPGRTNVSEQQLEEAGFVDPDRHMSSMSLERFGRFMALGAAAHERLLPEPHWYLMILGVDPPHQGRGLGGGLMAPTLAQADAAGLPCYLETTKARNVAFYRKHGFEVVDEQAAGDDGPTMWMMIRPPIQP